jgi:DNA-binding CsgD family transcriptional regulator
MSVSAKQSGAAIVSLLTRRQRDVLHQLLDGKPNKTIAQHLGLSSRTVEAHRARIMSKLSVSSIAELVRRTDPRRFEQDFIGSVVASFPGIIGFWGADLTSHFANDGYLEWFGKPGSAVIGMSIHDVIGPKLVAANKPYIEGALAGRAQRFTRMLVKPDGTPGLALVQYVPSFGQAGQPYGFWAFVTDITPSECPIR